jgi:hypothetical protein
MQQQISDYLVALIRGLKDDDDNPLFGQVEDHMPKSLVFDKIPYAYLVPEDQPAEFATNKQNDRHEGFKLQICLPLETKSLSRSEAFRKARVLCDAVRDAVDATYDLDGLTSPDHKNTVMDVKPVSSGWGYGESNMGEAIIQQLTINVRYTHNLY